MDPPREPSSPTLSRTTTQVSLSEHQQTTPKSSFLSRRRGDSDSAGKTFVTFGNGNGNKGTVRPSSSPGSGGRTATVFASLCFTHVQFEELTQQLEVEEKIKAGAENLLKVRPVSCLSDIRSTMLSINQQKQIKSNPGNKQKRLSTSQTRKLQTLKRSSNLAPRVHAG
jgi:hypothetical protein